MNRKQYMEELAKLLSDIPEQEKEEVLDFYEGYFDDAGEEREQEVIAGLGSPEKLSLSIHYNLKESNEDYAEYTERGYEDSRIREEGYVPDQYTVVGHSRIHKKEKRGYSDNEKTDTRENHSEKQRRGSHGGNAKLILFIILMVFLAPFLKGLIGGVVISVLVTIAVVAGLPLIGIILAALVTAAFAVAGIALLVTAVPMIFGNLAAAILFVGFAMLCFAAAVIGVMVTRWMVIRILPGFIRRFSDLCSRILDRFRKRR